MTRLAFLSDIHGNLPALEAVLSDVRTAAPDAVYVLGDMVNGCCWSAQVLDRLAELGWPMLMGNHDDAVLQLDTPRMAPRFADRERYAAMWWTRANLADRHLETLERLPLERRLDPGDAPVLRLVHGVPGSFMIGFLPNAPESWAAGRLAAVSEDTLCGGHTHASVIRRIRRPAAPDGGGTGSWQVVNCGSVGAPYDGDRRAGYALLTSTAAAWQAEIRRVPYDLAAVEAGYRQSGLAAGGGVMGEMFIRSIRTGLPWVADFAWWVHDQPAGALTDMHEALRRYDARHGPGRWAFPYAA